MFNTGIGQHILKNPLIVNSIIDKVGVVEERERGICWILNFILTTLKQRENVGHKVDAWQVFVERVKKWSRIHRPGQN